MPTTVKIGNKVYPAKTIVFSGGELHTKLDCEGAEGRLIVVSRLQSAKDIIELVLVKEILDRKYDGSMELAIPYFPYARQDRVTESYCSFSLKAITKIINSLDFEAVHVMDLHSTVAAALIENCLEIESYEIIKRNAPLVEFMTTNRPVIVSPDVGAYKKSFKIASEYGLDIVTAMKERDVSNGSIIKTVLLDFEEKIKGKDCLITDDICDGGTTFVELAKVLKEQGAKSITLYVTHGIFSKGYGVFNGLIDAVYITDSFIPDTYPLPEQVSLFVHKFVKKELHNED